MENDLLCIRTEIFTRFSGFFFPYNVSEATARQPMINCQSDPRAVVKSSLLPSLLIIFLFRFCRLISQDLCPNCYRSNFG